MKDINKEKFWQEYSELLTIHKDILVGKDKKKSEEFPLSGSTYYKSTSNYQQELPKDKTFVPVMKKIFNSSTPKTWINNLPYTELTKYIARRFSQFNEHEVYFNETCANPSIYESYIIATSISARGIKKSELINGLAFLKATINLPINEVENSVPKNVISGFASFSKKQIEKFVEKEILTERDNYYHFYKKDLNISSMPHDHNLRRIDLLKPFLHRYQSKVEGYALKYLSMNQEDISSLRNDLVSLINKYSDKGSPPSENDEIVQISLSISSLIFDEFIKEDN